MCPLEGESFLARDCVPDLARYCPCLRKRCVCRPGCTPRSKPRPCVPMRERASCPVTPVPHLQCAVHAPGDDAFAIRAERYARDRARVALGGKSSYFARGDVPPRFTSPHVLCASSHRIPRLYPLTMQLAVGAEGHAGDRVGVALQGARLLARGCVPHFHPSCPRSRRRCACHRG